MSEEVVTDESIGNPVPAGPMCTQCRRKMFRDLCQSLYVVYINWSPAPETGFQHLVHPPLAPARCCHEICAFYRGPRQCGP
jgi:hypothetical protein